MLPIILAIKNADDREFVESTYRFYKERLFMTSYDIVKNDEDAYDCVHDTVVALINSLERFRSLDASVQTKYLIRCCKNISINKYNKKKHNNESVILNNFTNDDDNFDVADNSPTPCDFSITEENVKRIAKLIENLKPIYSEVLFFSLFIHMTNGEIAKVLGISENLVGVRLHRAKRELIKTNGGELNDICRK